MADTRRRKSASRKRMPGKSTPRKTSGRVRKTKRQRVRERNLHVGLAIAGVCVMLLCVSSIIRWRQGKEESREPVKRAEILQMAVNQEYFRFDGPYVSYEDSQGGITSAAGIDVSAHQENVDWSSVKNAGIQFAMLRLGYRGYGNGALMQDEDFAVHLKEAADAGLEVGVYFYSQALTAEEAKEEAQFVLKHLNGKALSYPVAYDFEIPEDPSARTADISETQIFENAAAFCQVIQEAGYAPMLYANHLTYPIYTQQELLDEIPIWYCEYGTQYPGAGEFAMWQYTDTGEISGIASSYVDLNVVFLKKEE